MGRGVGEGGVVGAEGKVLGKIPSCVGQETPLLLNLWKSEWNL